ncbi:MAG TPA: NAD-dependent epimerase/dehydratase family protein [Candidatus Limnocylindrales bacterium]|nr:NAD-dependent epimerase/dehydratase family protein [Candidatus Limnocylindrales bacterium]
MKILITGGAGFIGSHLADAFLARGDEVSVMDNLSSGHREQVPAGARFHEVDIRDERAAQIVSEERPDVLCHHAAQMNVRYSVENPAYDAEVNVLGMVRLLEAARGAGTRLALFSSSGGTVYGEVDQYPTPEEHPTVPVCPYGITKLTGEHYLEYYWRIHGLRYVALRYANVYGPRQDPHGEAGVVAIFSKALLRGVPGNIFGDGLQTRDYVFVGDVVRANLASVDSLTDDAAGNGWCGPVNIGTGRETNVVELHERIARLAGADVRPNHVEAKEGEVRRNCLSYARAERVLGWKPSVSLDDGLAQTVDFFRTRS